MSDGIFDVFHSAGLTGQTSPYFPRSSFEAPTSKQPSLAVETLRRLLAGEIHSRSATNIVEARKLSKRLDETLRRYHNRAVDSLQVIEELISLAKDLGTAKKRGAELGLNEEELAFYDALAENGSASELMAYEAIWVLAQALVETIRKSATIDWTRKERVRAKIRIEVRKLLARYGYPPDLQRAAVDLIIKQAKILAARCA